jgi:hypothetical protein
VFSIARRIRITKLIIAMDQTERELRDMLEDRRLVRWPTEPQWNAIWLAANAPGYTGGVSAAVHGVAPDLLDVDWVGLMGADAEQAKMMWSELRLRRSVTPFRLTSSPLPVAADPDAATAQQAQIAGLVAQHWEVISDGPSGVQLRAPRTMKLLDLLGLALGLACFALGFLTVMAYGFGLILIGLALLDYYVFTKPETRFLPPP